MKSDEITRFSTTAQNSLRCINISSFFWLLITETIVKGISLAIGLELLKLLEGRQVINSICSHYALLTLLLLDWSQELLLWLLSNRRKLKALKAYKRTNLCLINVEDCVIFHILLRQMILFLFKVFFNLNQAFAPVVWNTKESPNSIHQSHHHKSNSNTM